MAAGVSPSRVLSAAAVTGPFSRISRAILARVLRSGMPVPTAAPLVPGRPPGQQIRSAHTFHNTSVA